MKGLGRLVLLGSLIALLMPGMALAVPTPYNFYNVDGDTVPDAVVWAEKLAGSPFQYNYYVQNIAFDPDPTASLDGGMPDIAYLDIELWDPALTWGWDTTDTANVGVTSIGIGAPIFMDPFGGVIAPGIVRVSFESGFSAGTRSVDFWLVSSLDEGLVEATLGDHGETSTSDVIGSFVAPGDHQATDPVPEPGTLLLIGTGLLGAAGFRRLRKKTKRLLQ
jgi:hypothetical protein